MANAESGNVVGIGRVMLSATGSAAVSGLAWQAFASLAKGQFGVRAHLVLVDLGGGYGLFLENRSVGAGMVCLHAEKSGKLRVFKRAETALALCRELGAKSVMVRFQELDGRVSP